MPGDPPPLASPDPATYTASAWLVVLSPGYTRPAATPHGGKWLVFVPVAEVTAWWHRIATATAAGLLGPLTKVATAHPSRLAADPQRRVICVYTADARDVADVFQVRAALRALGVTWAIGYKTDAATRAGRYAPPDDRAVCCYWE